MKTFRVQCELWRAKSIDGRTALSLKLIAAAPGSAPNLDLRLLWWGIGCLE